MMSLATSLCKEAGHSRHSRVLDPEILAIRLEVVAYLEASRHVLLDLLQSTHLAYQPIGFLESNLHFALEKTDYSRGKIVSRLALQTFVLCQGKQSLY
jgi:hypothetical protein